MAWLKITFLIAALLSTSGYRFRCYLACVDQTGTQNDYVEQRDYCREYAQLKVNMATKEGGPEVDDRSRKSTLVSLFSQCMGKNGWVVPDGKGDSGKTMVVAASAGAPPSAAVIATNKAEEKSSLTRSAECAFARHSASVSSNAALRAEACDLECSEALRLSPSAPRPPSCPSDLGPKYSKGNEN